MMTETLMMAAAFAPIPETWVDAVEQVESSGRGAYTPAGDRGRATGPFQFWSVAWQDCSKIRKSKGLSVYPYSRAKDPAIARQYAVTWLSWLRSQVSRELGRPANLGETWLAYNLGMKGFGRYGYQIAKVPDHKFIKAAALNASVR